MSVGTGTPWSPDEVAEVANWQKYMIWLILAQFLAGFLLVASSIMAKVFKGNDVLVGLIGLLTSVVLISILVSSVYGVYKMASSLRKGLAVLYAVLMAVPYLNIIVLLVLNGQATRTLQANKVRVGFMGANSKDVERLRNEASLVA